MKALLSAMKDIWQTKPRETSSVADVLARLGTGFCIGLLAGAIISVFRITTDQAFGWILEKAANLDWLSFLTVGSLALLAAIITGFLVRNKAIRFGGASWIRMAIASGAQHPWTKVLFPKFLGSWLVMAMGISVGREGPCIQMGAASALGLRNFPTSRAVERRFFILGGSAAGLAAAFSAPFAGVCYVYEVMKEKLSPMLFSFLLAGAIGVFVSCSLIFGLDVMLPMEPAPLPLGWLFLLILPLGIFASLVGVAYSFLLRLSMELYGRQKLFPPAWRPLFAFFAAVVFLFFFPAVTGEGLSVFKGMLDGSALAGFLVLFLVVKLLLTAFCYGSGIPAGVMVPILCLGGVAGGIYADLLLYFSLVPPELYSSFIVMGMGGAFAASERAPITALVLVSQMTGAWSLSAAMLVVCAMGALSARLCRVKSL